MIELLAEWGPPPDLPTALKQANAAASIGASFSKWQMYRADDIASKDAARYWSDELGGSDSQREQFEQGGLDADEWRALAYRCKEIDVGFLVTPFSLAAVDLLEDIGASAYKIASGDITYRPLIEKIGRTGKRVFLSTGAANEREIDRALRWLKKCPTTVLACDLAYPCPAEAAALAQKIPALRRHTLDYGIEGVGYSDHTREVVTGAVAAALGATVLEKHCTLDPLGGSPDDRFALAPEEAREYLRLANAAEALCAAVEGDPEAAARIGARRSAYAARDLMAGQQLVEGDVVWLRPCEPGALEPSRKLIGRTILYAVGEGESIHRDAIA